MYMYMNRDSLHQFSHTHILNSYSNTRANQSFSRPRLYHEEGHGAPSVNSAVLDVGLVSQVIRGLYGDLHPLDSQESCQIGCIGRDDDQSERPPVGDRGKKNIKYGQSG